MGAFLRREAVLKPLYVSVRCQCSTDSSGLSTHIIFYFEAFGRCASCLLICMQCGGHWREKNTELKSRLDGFAESALAHPSNEKWIH